jgi:hypothetical protein
MRTLRPSLRPLFVLFLALLVPCNSRAQQPAATWLHGSLSLSIPYHSSQRGEGRLITEVLDPEDHVLGTTQRTVQVASGDGVWQQSITPEKPLAFEELIWQRLRYRFAYDKAAAPPIEGIEPISEILRRPVVHILGQTQYLSGSCAAVRVIVGDATHNDTPQTGSLRIELLQPGHEPMALFSGHLNRRGTLEAQFRFPAGLTGKFDMRYTAETPIGATEFTQPIELQDKASILLTTEKPIYQPGQSIHVRALALDRAEHKAEQNRHLTFEIEDSHGNKVFKKATQTDKFGIASAEFSLADEVNLGTYHLRALMGDPANPTNSAELALNVERYVLPKFKVAIEFAARDNKPKRDYRPGDHVTGIVRANYFFGKPVDHSEITVKISAMDVAVFQAASVTGTTDADGAYHFDLKLPNYFAGHPLSQGSARALVEATVKDATAHAETRGEPITVSQSSILITAIPEGGTLIPRLENRVYLLTAYPDGTPASTSLNVHMPDRISATPDQQVSTDSAGVAVLNLDALPGTESFRIDADDHKGNRATTTIELGSRSGSDQILLRSNRPVFKAGDHIQLTLLSTRSRGTAYVDIVKNGQTLLTRDVDLVNGQASLSITATPDMAGTLDIDAYLFGRDAQPVADHRLLFVQPANALKIETTTDAAVYKPGADATVHFHVTNSHGEGVSAALGLQVVDEAVFALAEKQPGFAKVFFYLEQEVMKPRYEIHSLSLANVVEPAAESLNDEQDLAASALFSATEIASPIRLDTVFGRTLPQDRYNEYQQRYRDAFIEQVRQIVAKLNQSPAKSPDDKSFLKAFTSTAHDSGNLAADAWGTPFRIEPANRYRVTGSLYRVRSAGPDRHFNTGDDLAVYVRDHSAAVTDQPTPADRLSLRVEHDRGPFNSLAELTGTVFDPSGAIIPGATVTLRRRATNATRTANTDRSGSFTFAGLTPGNYTAHISSRGFQEASFDFTVQARDLAVLSANLPVGSVSETVTVETDAEVLGGLRGARMINGMANGAGMGLAADGMAFADAATVVVDAESAVLALPMQASSSLVQKARTSEAPAAHVRSYFPEALYINPEILTDSKGNANIAIPMADSITTWRMAMLASTQAGALGTASSSIKVFQDFFVDLDLPVTLTQGDHVSIPVGIYNYSGKRGRVSLQLQPDDWYTLDADLPRKSVMVDSGKVGAAQFSLNAQRIGKFKLTLTAAMEGDKNRQDIVVREIEVVPNGKEQATVFNGHLESTAQHELHFPATTISDATSILVRLYPGPLSQVIEGMDSILRMPGGCFEQTSSSTYPNVLALDYMKRTKKLTPEVHAKAEGYIANGYQRLLTFEVPGGGFSWFGQAPANKILTAYGLMEFHDMSKVSDVDPKLIRRTSDWLASQQQPDGSWKPDSNFINEGATNRFNSDVLRITAYIAWSLANTGYQGPAIERAKRFLEDHSAAKADAYTLAVIANFAADDARDGDFTRRSMQALIDARTEKGDQVFWTSEETGVYSTGTSAAIETTGLATQALLKWGQASGVVRKALTYIASKKQASGNWGTTQATIMALRSLLMASEHSTSDIHGKVQVLLNGKLAETLQLTSDSNDLLHQFAFKNIHPDEPTSVQLSFDGSGGLAYQVVGRYFTPWEQKAPEEPLSITLAYDRTQLAQNDIVNETATVHNHLSKRANMVMVDLGIPPGFDLLSEDLQTILEKTATKSDGRLEKFSLTGTQAILYFNSLAPNETVTLPFRLRAKYPVRAKTFESRVYEYYDPAVAGHAVPIQLNVRDK